MAKSKDGTKRKDAGSRIANINSQKKVASREINLWETIYVHFLTISLFENIKSTDYEELGASFGNSNIIVSNRGFD